MPLQSLKVTLSHDDWILDASCCTFVYTKKQYLNVLQEKRLGMLLNWQAFLLENGCDRVSPGLT